MEEYLSNFEQQLLQLYPIRSSTMAYLELHARILELSAGESSPRTEDQVSFVVSGVLKEYDARYRRSPAIVNFYVADQFILSHRHNKNHYLKAIIPTRIITVSLSSDDFGIRSELLELMQVLYMEQELRSQFRQRVLEQRGTKMRLKLFVEQYRSVLPYLSKRDISRYLQVSYFQVVRLMEI